MPPPELNPHVPQYIAQTPWYLGGKKDSQSLDHQRSTQTAKVTPVAEDVRWHKRGLREDDAEVGERFRKGACSNCGATTHEAKTCVERPRKLNANLLKRKLAADEVIPETAVDGFEAKRDRWGAFCPQTDYQDTIKEFTVLEKAAEAMGVDLLGAAEEDGAKTGAAIKASTTGNLRIREDTAKYLINLDLDSAFFDPKSRSMREDPTVGLDEERKRKIAFRGDNAMRESEDVKDAKRIEVFAWARSERKLHAVANPTATVLEFQRAKQPPTLLPTQPPHYDPDIAQKYQPITHPLDSDDE